MAEPVHISTVMRDVMKNLERKRAIQTKKDFASTGFAQGCGLSPRPAGIKKAGIGGLDENLARQG